MKKVYIIMSPSGGIGLDMTTNEGTCYSDLNKAKKALESKNEWSSHRGYGIYYLVTLNVKEVEKIDD